MPPCTWARRSNSWLVRLAPIIRSPALLEFLLQIIKTLLRGVRRGLVDINLGLFGLHFGGEVGFGDGINLPHLLNLQQIQFVFGKLLQLFGLCQVLAGRFELRLPVIARFELCLPETRTACCRSPPDDGGAAGLDGGWLGCGGSSGAGGSELRASPGTGAGRLSLVKTLVAFLAFLSCLLAELPRQIPQRFLLLRLGDKRHGRAQQKNR